MQTIPVLDSYMAFREGGQGVPLVFLHGNPTSSYLWRKVLPVLQGEARCLAPDLIGMGGSGKPDIAYRLADHVRYLDAWFEAMRLEQAVLVGHDWGGVLAMDFAARHPALVRGLVVFETFLRSLAWSEWSPQGLQFFQTLRTAGLGERLVLEENGFLPKSLAHGVITGLSEEARAAYYAPYPDAKSRRPMLQWPREVPIEGEPAEVTRVVENYGRWLAESPTPKLYLTFENAGMLSSESMVAWARKNMKQVRIEKLGPAGHHAPEDQPLAIAAAIARFLPSTRHLAGQAA